MGCLCKIQIGNPKCAFNMYMAIKMNSAHFQHFQLEKACTFIKSNRIHVGQCAFFYTDPTEHPKSILDIHDAT